MLPAPIFRHELKAASGRYRLIPIRATLALLLAALAIAIDMAIFDQVDAESQIYNDEWVGRPCRALTGKSLVPWSEPREPTT
jgi:hypothetical protein